MSRCRQIISEEEEWFLKTPAEQDEYLFSLAELRNSRLCSYNESFLVLINVFEILS